MKSTIIKFIREGNEYVTVGNEPYIQKVKETADQIICLLDIDHGLQEWYELENMTQQDLFDILIAELETSLYTKYVN